MLDVQRVDPLLWIWTTDHPQWTTDGGGWGRAVHSVFAERPDAIVLIDPLVPTDPLEGERFYAALDRDVERRGVPVSIVCTLAWHRRSCGLLRERYEGSLYAPEAGVSGVDGASVVAAETMIADGVVLHPLAAPGVDELAVRIESDTATLVFGDAVLGRQPFDSDERAALTVSPLDWFEAGAETWYAQDLPGRLELLAQDVEVVVPSHGEVVLTGGGDALLHAVSRLRG